ncbi:MULTISPECIES: MbcA/ParS/Xre antitoxin family protein [unclassified Marinobacter]|uniref:MbcA/ParS/Xre antitoxin family protein n=1 Tax=unclassified Marinobacter TaxID=83889 RepID=UPI000C95C9C3|nr:MULTISPECIES: MbcA/ParS/Xre antitoxin family protein [unclassified Marinobacter]MAB52970.1 hypothetical protein [Marinobacter sp.]
MSQAKRWVTGVTDVNEEEVVAELREQVYREVVALWEGDKANADRWLSSPIRALGDRTPISMMETKPELQKIRSLIDKWQRGAVS